MHSLPNPTPKRIDVLVYPGFKGIEAIGAMSVFEYANIHLQQQGRPAGYVLRIVSSTAGPVASDMHMQLQAQALREDDLPHTAIVVGARQIEQALVANPVLVERPIVVSPKGTRLCRPKERVLDLL